LSLAVKKILRAQGYGPDLTAHPVGSGFKPAAL